MQNPVETCLSKAMRYSAIGTSLHIQNDDEKFLTEPY